MNFVIKPIVSDYAVICVDTGRVVCVCNIKRNAELIADILEADNDNSCAYSYEAYPNAKYKVFKTESVDYGIKEIKDMTKEEKLIDELSKMPLNVLATAYLYAINLNLYGEDVTEKWSTATQNANALQVAYNKGYHDAKKEI